MYALNHSDKPGLASNDREKYMNMIMSAAHIYQ